MTCVGMVLSLMGVTLAQRPSLWNAFNSNRATYAVGKSDFTLRDAITCPFFNGILYSLPPTLYLW